LKYLKGVLQEYFLAEADRQHRHSEERVEKVAGKIAKKRGAFFFLPSRIGNTTIIVIKK